MTVQQTHPAANATDRAAATIHVTQGAPRHNDTLRNYPGTSDRTDRGHSRERNRRSSSLDSRRPRQHQDASSTRSGRSGQSTTTRSTTAPPRNMDIQCKACATNGHTHLECRLFPKVASVIEYMTMNPMEAKETLQHYDCKAQHPDARKAAREKYVKVLQGRIADPDELQDMVDQLEGEYCWPDPECDYSASICRLAPVISASIESVSEYLSAPPRFTSHDLRITAQPISYSDMSQILVPTVLKMETRQAVHHPELTPAPLCVIHGTSAQMDNRRDLADTVASVSATGRLDILHDFTPRTPYDIMGYDGRRTRAAGQGMAQIKHPTTGAIDDMFFVYIPSIQGTIVSLEHHAKTHPNIHRWTQEATPATQSGWVTFLDAHDTVVSRYETIQHKGLYYLQDLNFVPAPISASMASLNQLDYTHLIPSRTTALSKPAAPPT